jgi:hypothetical protein
MARQSVGAESARDNIIPFNVPPRVRNDVPPFDASNPAHVRAWESMWDWAQWEKRNGK